ncbi:spindle and kinetochore-associated protein 2 [Ictalurus punctatus]|uniref:Protein FAM33A n=1 Tax=Ictalurus punctatus TaxID=7998 RepID=E3TEA6_ICTPU|nr:spindle and kinetochore-associated protein 2 [Ictalurus punctatus]ADO28642.1 spindle and kinetochore-associated protein 2 [Ictalurus punctatus]
METAVDKLEAMFQKAEADIEYVEKRLKFDFMTSARENSTAEGNPVQLLESLAAIKARHGALCVQMEEIAAEQKRSMDSIRSHLNTTVKLVEELQNTTDMQVPPLTQEEQEARDSLCSSITALSIKTQCEVHTQQESKSQEKCRDVKDAEFEAVPRSVRGNIKLSDLNALYTQLTEHFSSDNNRAPLSLQKMRKLNMRVSEAAVKTLMHLGLVELDRKGSVSLPSSH